MVTYPVIIHLGAIAFLIFSRPVMPTKDAAGLQQSPVPSVSFSDSIKLKI